MKIAVGFILGLFVFSSCSNFNAQVEKQEMLNLLKQQSLNWNSGNIEAFMQGYWKSDKLRFASGDKVTFGWQQTLDNYKKSYPSKAAMGELVFSEISVEILSKNEVLVFGRWKLNRGDNNPQGLFTLHLHKFAQGWKIVSDHTS